MTTPAPGRWEAPEKQPCFCHDYAGPQGRWEAPEKLPGFCHDHAGPGPVGSS